MALPHMLQRRASGLLYGSRGASLLGTSRNASASSASAASIAAQGEEIIRRTNRLFLENAYVDAEGGATLPVVSPADGQPFTTISHASPRDVDRAVRSAKACFDSKDWSKAPVHKRVEVLQRLADALRQPETAASLSWIESRDCGKPLAESAADMQMCADLCDYYAGVAPAQMEATPVPMLPSQQDFSARMEHEPLGVVGCITPWNFPLFQAVIKVAPALAAGCTVVLKPSPLASLTCCALGELVAEAGAPPGALNVITGGPPQLIEGHSTGQSLIDHDLLDKVSFTGSGLGGQKMLESSAMKLRPTSLELGGKSAFVIFEDAVEYLDTVVDWVLVGIFSCSGQVCSATSRLIVHKDIEPTLTSRLIEAAAKIKVGDPLAEGTQMGPLVSEAQKQKVMSMLRQAASEGCKAHAAGLELPQDLQGGFYVPPTILTEVSTGATAWREEIFGPVLVVHSFREEEEAIKLANDTPYGLANAVYTADPARRARVASRLQSGVVWENCNQALFPQTPFGGKLGKVSGFGHEGGLVGLQEYLSHKTVISAVTPGYSWGAYSG